MRFSQLYTCFFRLVLLDAICTFSGISFTLSAQEHFAEFAPPVSVDLLKSEEPLNRIFNFDPSAFDLQFINSSAVAPKLFSGALKNSGVMMGMPSTAMNSTFRPVHTSVEVNASEQSELEGMAAPYHATQAEILASAGTYGDVERYLEAMPGAVWNSDESNDLLVRGGNPAENLFVVDGIEVPNINHIALSGTTGGFTSMIDTSTIGSVEMKPGVFDARYSSRLSALIDIHTLDGKDKVRSGETELGISGIGGFVEQPIAKNGSLLFAAHRSLLNLFTDDIGLNGVPIYTNGMARLDMSAGKNDHLSVLSLNGGDSINIQPCAGDRMESLNIDTQYQGMQSTNGLVWQHTHNPKAVSTLTGSYSRQNHYIAQQEQSSSMDHFSCSPLGFTNVYQEESRDGIANLAYGQQREFRGWLFSLGSGGHLLSLNDAVAQPAGEQSPFNTSSAATDATSFARRLNSGQTGSYLEANGHFSTRWTAIAGLREETFALVGARAFEPHASLAYRINDHQAIHAEFGRSAQLAPAINILSYAQNARLKPLLAEQFSVGANLWSTGPVTLSLQAYHKRYSNEPASTEYPSLMLANMVDTLGQQFVWLPMNSVGRGESEGLELIARLRVSHRLQFLGTTSYAQTRYAAADGVLRPGNFDLPLVVNALATLHLPAAIQLSLRNTLASGRPYTPFNISESVQQDRGVYDLTQINALRGPVYNRFDFQFSRDFHLRKNLINFQGGLENALDRANFLGFAWMSRCSATKSCLAKYGGALEVTQMPLFPNFSAKYVF